MHRHELHEHPLDLLLDDLAVVEQLRVLDHRLGHAAVHLLQGLLGGGGRGAVDPRQQQQRGEAEDPRQREAEAQAQAHAGSSSVSSAASAKR